MPTCLSPFSQYLFECVKESHLLFKYNLMLLIPPWWQWQSIQLWEHSLMLFTVSRIEVSTQTACPQPRTVRTIDFIDTWTLIMDGSPRNTTYLVISLKFHNMCFPICSRRTQFFQPIPGITLKFPILTGKYFLLILEMCTIHNSK